MNHPNTINEKAPAFLCTTALEDFWDKSSHVLFLSKGCLRYSRKSIWAPLRSTILESPWQNEQKLREGYNYVMTVYERLLPLIAESLNSIHGERWSERYWRIVIGPWLLFYLHTVYEKYTSLINAFDKYPNLETIGLSEKSFVIPLNTLDFIGLANRDPYNLQLYTNIMLAIGKDFARKELEFNSFRQSGLIQTTNKETIFKSFLQDIYSFLQKKIVGYNSIVLKQSYFTRAMEVQLFIKTLGKVSSNKVKRIDLPKFNPDSQIRQIIAERLRAQDDLEAVLSKLLPFDIPFCFIEGYATVRQEMKKNYFIRPKAIFSANSWYYDEGFKWWAAECSEYGTILLGCQHGGCYGINKHIFFEDHERKLVDSYYTWGWSEKDSKTQLLPFTATYLSGRKQRVINKTMDDILYPTIMESRFSYQLPCTIDYLIKYLEYQNEFILSIQPGLHKLLRFRVINDALGWDVIQSLKERFPDVRIEHSYEIPFEESLRNCRLYVTDYLGTTYMEALIANKPTILFHDGKMMHNEWRADAQYYYNKLKSAGILYNSPQEAAYVVNTVYNDVEEWWNRPERQIALKEFCDRFARTSPNALREWMEEFRRIARLKRESSND